VRSSPHVQAEKGVERTLTNERVRYGQRPRLLDLFCGAGGAAVGYHRAGFDVVGVDIAPQPRYPFEFVQDDALLVLSGEGGRGWVEERFEAIHASPPCQAYTQLSNGDHPRLIEPVRELLQATGLPYVIENVVGAPLLEPTLLCGSMFGLNVRRHRLFETSFDVMAPKCQHGWTDEIRAYYGKSGWLAWKGHKSILRGSVEQAPVDMGIDWMTWDELREAIPPVYTELIGHQLMSHLKAAADVA
jgi:DNA (cytosine-5)-methyltransferase 1